MKKMKARQTMALLMSLVFVMTSIVSPSMTVFAETTANEPQSITLSTKSKEVMYVGMSKKIKVKKVTPKNSSKKVTYESSAPEIVKITGGGTMKALMEGKAVITVTSAFNKEVSKKVEVTVKNLVKNKTYNKMVIPLDRKNKTRKLSRVSKVKASYLNFSSSRKKVATVSKAGVLTGKKVGTTKITIKGKKGLVKGAKQVITLYVAKKSVETVALDKTSVTLKPGDPMKLTTTVTPENAANVVVFTTSDKDVATVDQNGNVTAVKEGTAEITATTVDGGKKAVCVVTVSRDTNNKTSEATTEKENSGATTEKENSGATTEKENSGATTEKENSGATTEKENGGATIEKENSGATTEETTEQPVTPENLTVRDMYEKVPYVSTYYFEPKPDYRQEVVIPIYITDYEQSEYLKNDTTKAIDLLYEVDGQEYYIRDMKLGDNEVNLGKLTIGEHYFALQAIDKTTGLTSHKLYNDLLVVDPEKEKITEEQTYQITDEDLAKYKINKESSTEESDLINTRDGLNQLFVDIQAKGYRKCILPEGTYRIQSTNRTECIKIPSYLTVDMNGSTFKLDTVKENIGALLVSFNNVDDAHLINGTVEGDRFERKALGLEHGYEGEGINTIAFSGGKYCSIDHLVVKNTTGHTVGTGGTGGAWTGFKEYTPVRVVDGEEVSDENCCTTNYADLTKIKSESPYVRVGQGNGYRGLRGSSPIIYVHFYDKDKNFIKTETAYQYRKIRIPEDATYGRVTYLGTVDASDKYNSFYVKGLGDFIEITNVDFYDTRTTALAPSACSNLLIENCTYTRCGNSITPSSVDFEDGWQECQDVYYRNNTDYERPGSATTIDNTGFNHVYENLKGHRVVIRRSNMGAVVRNIDDMEGTTISWSTGNIVNSKFCRNYNNKTLENTMYHGNETIELSKHKVKNCVIAASYITAATDSVVYDDCTFTNFGAGKIVCKNCTINPSSSGYFRENLYFYDCTFKNMDESREEMQFNIHSVNGERIFDHCKFEGKSYFSGNNNIAFKNCSFDDVRFLTGLGEEANAPGATFDNCTMNSTAEEFIRLGFNAYDRNYCSMIFNNCNITHIGNIFFYLRGKPIGNSKIEFHDSTINKDSGLLLSGWSTLSNCPETSLKILFERTQMNKEVDATYAEDQSKVKIIYTEE